MTIKGDSEDKMITREGYSKIKTSYIKSQDFKGNQKRNIKYK